MKLLFIAPASNLAVGEEILASISGETVTLCVGNVDRAKAEQYLCNGRQYDWVHFAGHGDLSILQWSDGVIEVGELIGMLQQQTHLRGVTITACSSARTGSEIHNALHCPTIMCQTPINDPAAVRFSETFYRTLRLGGQVKPAVEAGRAALAKVSPNDADCVTLINGDMLTSEQAGDLRSYLEQELGFMRGELAGIKEDVADMKREQPKAIVTALVLLALLLLAEVANPFLTALASGR